MNVTKILKSVSLILSIAAFLFSLGYAFVSLSLSVALNGDGLFGMTPTPIDYIPLISIIMSFIIIFFTFNRFQSVTLWICSIINVTSVIVAVG